MVRRATPDSTAARATAVRNRGQQTRIERLGYQIIPSELHLLDPVGLQHRSRNRFARQVGQGVSRGEFHRLVDLRGPHVERPAEDVGKPSTLFT